MMYRATRHVKTDNSTRMITGSARLGENMYIARARTGSMCTSRSPDGSVDGGLLRRLGDRRPHGGRLLLRESGRAHELLCSDRRKLCYLLWRLVFATTDFRTYWRSLIRTVSGTIHLGGTDDRAHDARAFA